MSTNYYLRENSCPCCNRYDEIHVGKSSVGWRFALNGLYRPTYAVWLNKIRNSTIWNEYDNIIPSEDLINLIEESKNGEPHTPSPDYRIRSDGPADLLFFEFS